MKVLFDHQCFSMQSRGGISKFFVELIFKLKLEDKLIINTTFGINDNIHLKSKGLQQQNFIFRYFYLKVFSIKKHSFRMFLFQINKLFSIIRLIRGNYDVFVPTYYDPYFLKYIGHKPFILVIYDMIHELKSEGFDVNDPTSKWKKMLIDKAQTIVAISQSTKDDILNLYKDISSDRISVIHLAHQRIQTEDATELRLPKNYILFVGSRSSYKNFSLFFKAVEMILNEHEDVHLVCVGGQKFNQIEMNDILNSGHNDRIHFYSVNDESLSQIYSKAKLFVFPSLYEGFGIPVLEAMSEGCPVVLGHLSSFPEVAEDAAYYCDVTKVDSLYTAIKRLLLDEKLRQSYIDKGKIQVQKFTWDNNAKEWKILFDIIKKT